MENGKYKLSLLFVLLSFLLLPVSGLPYPLSGAEHGIKVENAYVRTAAQGMMSAGYFKIANSSDGPDTLYNVKASFAEMAQLHETYRKDGLVGMKQVKFVVVPAKSSVEFSPGGYHVMLMNVKENLKVGKKVKFELFFKRAGTVRVNAVVKD